MYEFDHIECVPNNVLICKITNLLGNFLLIDVWKPFKQGILGTNAFQDDKINKYSKF
jgi:hypothetical protein